MRIIIVGAGKLGLTLAGQLASEKNEVTVIDINREALSAISERFDVLTVEGNGAMRESLLLSGAETAELVVAVTGSDETNLLCCMTAHHLNPNLKTIARIRNPEYNNQIYEMRDLFALSMMVNPDKQAATEIERLLRYPGFLKLDTFARGRAEIVELKLEKDNPLCGKKLVDIGHTVDCRILICSVLRNGEVATPTGNFVLEEGDRIFVTAPSDNLTKLLRSLGTVKKRVKNVLLCGGGRTAIYLARQLCRSGIAVRIIEKNRNTCDELTHILPEAEIVHGDATKSDLLFGEGLAQADALISMTGIDEFNIIIALYAHNAGVGQVITKIDHIDDSRVLDELPIGSIVDPKSLCCSNIVRYVRAMKNQAGAALSVHFIADGKAEAIEFRVTKNTRHTEEPLKKLKLKSNLLIACISRSGRVEIPDGNSVFQAGDSVVIVSARDNPVLDLNDIFND